MLRPITTATTLRELLEEQRAALDRARVVPAASYLSSIEPIAPRAASAEPGVQKPRRLPTAASGNSRLHDLTAELGDIVAERTERGRTSFSDDERPMVERLIQKLHTMDPKLFAQVAPAAPRSPSPPQKPLRPPPLDTASPRSPEALSGNTASTPDAASSLGRTVDSVPGSPAPTQKRDLPVAAAADDGDLFGSLPRTSSIHGAGSEAGDTAAASSPAAGASGSSFRFSRQLRKLQAVSHNPEVYKSMVRSRDNLAALFKFSTACSSARLGSDAVLRVIEANFKEMLKADSCTVFTKTDDGWIQGIQTGFEDLAQSVTVITPPADLDVVIANGTLFREDDRLVVPITTDDAALACAELSGVRGETDQKFVSSLTQIASMFIVNNNSFLESKWQRMQVEAMLQMATQLAEETLEEERLTRSILKSLLKLVSADACSLFLIDGKKIEAVYTEGKQGTNGAMAAAVGRSVATVVLDDETVINIEDCHADSRFDVTVDIARGSRTGSLLSVPVFFEGHLVAVQQLYREHIEGVSTVFKDRDVELVDRFARFVGACLRNCRVSVAMEREKRKTDAILAVVRDMNNTDIRDVQSVVKQILTGARKLLNADRATLFLVDKERNELYSKIATDTGGQVIRFPIGKGIAGTVAKSAQAENIPDAYADPRFNKAVDVSLGYTTKSMLTEAILFQDEVIAVAQLVNKLESHGGIGIFTDRDQETFRAFSLFAGISLRNSHLLNFAVDAGREAMSLQEVREGRRKGGRSSLARNQEIESHLNTILQFELPQEVAESMGTPKFSLFDLREENNDNAYDLAVRVVLELVETQGYLEEFKCTREVFCRFILACRAKYRNVPYHNFFHAVDVCQTVFTFVHEGRVASSISRLDEFVLLVTALVHDLDHMGLNNSFHLKTDSPLGILSSASGNNSVLEVHHCNLAIEILNSPATDVFAQLDDEQKTHAYRRLIDCVLSTDMQRHNDVVTEFMGIDTFDVTNDTHLSLACKMILKAADISNVTKPFEVSRKWGMSVTEEFYQQGDKERAKGVAPLPMFDRSQHNELAKGQIGFIDFIAMPFFRKLSDRFVGLRWTVENISSNRENWAEILSRASTGQAQS